MSVESVRAANEYIKSYLAKWKELEQLGYRSGTSWGERNRTAIVKGDYPNGEIVGYLNRDLTIDWISDRRDRADEQSYN